jgi:hypothetical protein
VSELSAEGFQQKIDDILGDVKLGPSSVRRTSEKSVPYFVTCNIGAEKKK